MPARPKIQQIQMASPEGFGQYEMDGMGDGPVIGWALVDYDSHQRVQPIYAVREPGRAHVEVEIFTADEPAPMFDWAADDLPILADDED
ncbi:hypothetical protein [Gordonia sp. UBA6683]|uniref:hypothetical protein n=1 Tax=Gordonia sp. UBA6683 TaxID=1946577 RepID=UPI0025C4DE50|nr:hypothetical protein [Gordonia sp. UBA6683]